MTKPQEAWDRIAPFAMREIGDLLGMLGGTGAAVERDYIIRLYDTDTETSETYSWSQAGLQGALAAATSGDVVLMAGGTLSLTATMTIPSGAMLLGLGENTLLSFTGVTTGVSMGSSSTLADCSVTVVGTGTDIIGVDASSADALVHHVTVNVSGGSSTNYGVLLGGTGGGPSVMSVHGTSTNVTHATAGTWSVAEAGNAWRGIGLRMESTPTYNAGNLIVNFTVDTAAVAPGTGIKIMSANDAANSGVSPAITPILSGNTSGIAWPGVGAFTINGNTQAWQTDGYFCISSGWGPGGTYSAHLTSISWYDATTTLTHSLWTPSTGGTAAAIACDVIATGTGASAVRIVSTANANVYRNILAGDVYDIDNSVGGTCTTVGNAYTHARIAGLLSFGQGDAFHQHMISMAANWMRI